MKDLMKYRIVPLRLALILCAVAALPQLASAARGSKQWQITLSPTTLIVTPGVASSAASTVTIGQGSVLAASTNGVTLSVAVSPPGAGVTASLASTGIFTGVSSTTTLTITNTTAATAQAYAVTVTGASTLSGSSDFAAGDINVFTYYVGAPPAGKVWSPIGADTNWSTAGNWTPSGAPGSASDAQFFDTGAAASAGVVDNAVDSSQTIGSLTYGQTNLFHTTLIAAGKVLTIGGNTNGLNAGTGTAAGDFLQTVNTIKGAGGTLVVSNSGANVTVDQSQPISGTGNSSTMATLDLSGLDTFKATISRLLVGVDVSQALRGACGVLNLAKTNVVTVAVGSAAPQIDIGDNTQSGASPGLPSVLLLGQTNAIFADSIAVGRGKSYGGGGSSMMFNGSFANPAAYFRGTNGAASRVGTWTIGDGWSGKTSQNSGTNDFTGGTVNALVDQMFVGRGSSTNNLSGANVIGNGTLTFNAGTIDVNTLEVGYSQSVAGIGTVNVNGGTLVVNANLELAHGTGSAGALNVSGATVTASAGVTVGVGTATLALNSATLNTTNSAATIGTTGAPLSSLAITNSTLKMAAQGLSAASTVTTLQCDGANTINISSVPLIGALPAQFPLIQYSSASGNLAGFTLGALPASSPAYAGYLSNNLANSSIDLVITGGPIFYPLIWQGTGGGNWDVNLTADWRSNGVASTYQQGYLVVQFDDTLTGTSTVNLTTTLTPGVIKVNNSAANYTFSGPGKLSGGASLTKAGTGSLTLAESGGSDFSGGVTVSGGTLQVGAGGAAGSLGIGGVALATSTALTVNRSDNLTLSNLVSGVGTFTKNAGNILTLGGTNVAFSGEIIVAQGTLKIGNPLALGTVTGGTTINNGATLDVNGQKLNNTEPITVSGAGVGGAGAIINTATNNVTQALRVVTLTGSTTFGGNSDWDIHSSGNATTDGTLNTSDSTNKVTKVGTNTVTLFGVSVDGNLGDIDIRGGTLSFERTTTGLGNPANLITVFTNSTLQFQNASNVWSKGVVLKDGGTLRAASFAEFAGAVTIESGIATAYSAAGGQLLLDNALGGAGGLTKSGGGSVTLTSPSTYPGPTLVSAGTLSLANSGSIDSSTNITVSSGATLDLSTLADPTLTITGGRSLKGSGTVAGNVTMAVGSTLIPGGPGTNTVGTLTITNNIVLQAGSTNLMEVGKVGAAITNDLIVATNITYGGTLTVSGTGGRFLAGDTFKLFAAGAYNGSFSAMNLPVGMTWDTTQLGVNGTIRVISVTTPQITGGALTNVSGVIGFNVSFSGPAGNGYSLWASTNVAATPIPSTWTLVTNGVIGVNGNVAITDTNAGNYPARFYVISIP